MYDSEDKSDRQDPSSYTSTYNQNGVHGYGYNPRLGYGQHSLTYDSEESKLIEIV